MRRTSEFTDDDTTFNTEYAEQRGDSLILLIRIRGKSATEPVEGGTRRPAQQIRHPVADARVAERDKTLMPFVAPAERRRCHSSCDKRGHREEASDKHERGDKKEEPRTKRDATVTAPADGSQARLFVSLGKKHGVSADDLRALLAGPIGGDTSRIGSVSLRDSHAHVRVPEELVETIISGVHGTSHGEHSVTVERSRA